MMFPLAKPALATICLTLFVAYWNAYYEAMMYMDTGNYVTIPAAFAAYAGKGRLSQE